MRWSHLVVLMALGEGPEPFLRGVVSCRWFEPARFSNYPATGGQQQVDGLGLMSVYDASYRVFKYGADVRRERMDGTMSSIERGTEFWTLDVGEREAQHLRAVHMTFPDHQLTHRRPLREWSDDDFTRPTGPVTEVEYLGRRAWQVEVAPPPRKPHPLTWIVDDETGYVLSAVSAAAGSVHWTELQVGGDPDPALFVWTGPTRPFVPGGRRPPPG